MTDGIAIEKRVMSVSCPLRPFVFSQRFSFAWGLLFHTASIQFHDALKPLHQHLAVDSLWKMAAVFHCVHLLKFLELVRTPMCR
jgi:hypothetical protein